MTDKSLHDLPRKSLPREEVGPGGDPILSGQADSDDADGAGASVDCGWGRIVFGQTYPSAAGAAEVLRSEAAGTRDICVYLPAAHVFVTRHAAEFFVDPSLTYRLTLASGRDGEASRDDEPGRIGEAVPGVTVRRLGGVRDAEAVNRIYASSHMVTAPDASLVAAAERPEVIHLVAELPTGQIVGTVTAIDHVDLFDDPDNGSSLWCFTVDAAQAPPGVGAHLLRTLVDELRTRGRSFVDLSVLADNAGAIRFYEKLGFARTSDLVVKRKNPINEKLYRPSGPEYYDDLNPYARVIADEAMRRGIRVEVLDSAWGELRLTHGATVVHTRESLSELTSALAMARCDDKRVTRRILADAGLRVPAGVTLGGSDARDFLDRTGEVVVKPARGEQGRGVTVGVRDAEALERAIEDAQRYCPNVLVEERVAGKEVRVVVIDHAVAAAAVRAPAQVRGDGKRSVAELIERQSRRRAAATDGESRIPMDAGTIETVEAAGYGMEDVLPEGESLTVRRTANLHTGGTITDITASLHPALVDACVRATRALAIPVAGIDLLVAEPDRPDYAIIEVNERPGLANHEPQPVVERFIDLLFPLTAAPPRPWAPEGAALASAAPRDSR